MVIRDRQKHDDMPRQLERNPIDTGEVPRPRSITLSKKQRQAIWDKTGGKCWYCGCDLPGKWHADHVEPIIRKTKIVKDHSDSQYSHKVVSTGECCRPQHDIIDNMVPACIPCNLFKTTFSVEGFRQEIEAQAERVRRYSSGFRIAERFGLVEVKPQPVTFWFERQGL